MGSERPPRRVALVTGGSGGVGHGIAIELARTGCRVAVNYLDTPDRANAVVDELVAMGTEAMPVAGDVSKPADVRQMIDAVVARFGTLDVLVNNAGIQTWTALVDVTEDEWDRVIDTNLKGCFLCTQAA